MIDFWQRFFGQPYYGNNPSGFTPGGGTFPPSNGGNGTNFSNAGQPFGQAGPGVQNDLGHPFWPMGPSMPPEITDRSLNHPFDNMEAQDPRFAVNPDLPDGFNMPLGDDRKVYDQQQMQDLVAALRGSSPESLPNPAPYEVNDPNSAYGSTPQVPIYGSPTDPTLLNPFGSPAEQLFNPNRTPGTPGMEQISMQSTGTDFSIEPDPLPSPSPTPDMFPNQSSTTNVAGQDLPGTSSPTLNPVYNPAQNILSGIPPNPFGSPAPAPTPSFGQMENTPLVGNPQVAPNQGFTNGDYGQGFPMNSAPNPAGGVWLYDQNWNYVGSSPNSDGSPAPSTTAYGGNAPAEPVNAPFSPSANGIVGNNPYSYGPPAGPSGPVTQTSQGVPDGQGGFIPGTQLSEADAAKRYNTQAFNDPRYGVSDIFHPGQTMMKVLSDGTRIMVDATGKAINTVGQGAQDLWSNILNDPRNTDPAYLASIGYEEMGPEGSGFMMPFGVAGPSMGSTDVGTYGAINAGSYFHGGASAGAQHGATSVAGATAGGGGPPVQLSRYTTPGAYNDLRRWMGGRYTTPQSYSATQALAPNPFSSGPASIETPYQTLLSNQQYWGDQFKQRGYILPPTPASPGPQFPGGGRQTLSRGTPPHASP